MNEEFHRQWFSHFRYNITCNFHLLMKSVFYITLCHSKYKFTWHFHWFTWLSVITYMTKLFLLYFESVRLSIIWLDECQHVLCLSSYSLLCESVIMYWSSGSRTYIIILSLVYCSRRSFNKYPLHLSFTALHMLHKI